jgi:hypothetical protein
MPMASASEAWSPGIRNNPHPAFDCFSLALIIIVTKRHTAGSEHLLRAIAGRKRRYFRTSNRRLLPITSSLRTPASWPLTFRSEISQGIARRRVGNLRIDQREIARLAKRLSSSDKAAHRFSLKQQPSRTSWSAAPFPQISGDDRFCRMPVYLPMQKSRKITSSSSSMRTVPVMRPSARMASRRSSAARATSDASSARPSAFSASTSASR